MTKSKKQRDLHVLKNKCLWPCAEILPMQKFSSNRKDETIPVLGIIVAGKGPTIILAEVFDVVQNPARINDSNSQTYASFEAMIDDGWRID